MDEMWKDIEGYEGLYQVSNTGQAKSLNYKGSGEAKLLKQSTNKQGYKRITLCKNGKTKRYSVHRLVALAFIPNPDNLPIINHKDENPSNNNVNNLEWCTYKYNINYGTARKRAGEKMRGKTLSEEHKKKISKNNKGKHRSEETKKKISKSSKGKTFSEEHKKKLSESLKGKDNPNAKPILMYDREGNFIKRFDCIRDANEYFGKDRNSSIISECLIGRKKTTFGFIFIYADDNQDTLKKKINEANNKSGEGHKKPILMFDKEGNFIRQFDSINDTNEYFGKKKAYSNVSSCLTGRNKTAYGYVFKYAEENN